MNTNDTSNKGLTVYHSMKRIDESIVIGLIIGLSGWVLCPEVSEGALIYSVCAISAFAYIWQRVFYTGHLKRSIKFAEKRYEKNIDKLIFKLHEAGLVLKQFDGARYIFKSENIILPNDYFVIRDFEDYCTVTGKDIDFSQLEKIVRLKPLIKEAVYKEATEH